MAVDYRRRLVGVGDRLIEALAPEGDDSFRTAPEVEEGAKTVGVEAGAACGRGSQRPGEREGPFRPLRAGREERLLAEAAALELGKQGGEQGDVAAGCERQMQVGLLAGRGAARIDDHDAQLRPCRLGRRDAPEQDGIAPGEVAADENQEVAALEILVGAGYHVLAEGTDVGGDRARHAEPRVAVDVAGAEDPFGDFVRGVVTFGRLLPGDVERDALLAEALEGSAEARGDCVEREVPRGALAVHLGMKQPIDEVERLAECRALAAQPTVVGGMRRVARYGCAAPAVRFGDHAAA